MKLFSRILFSVSGGLPLLVVSGLLLMVWINPGSFDAGNWVKFAASLMMIEFVLLHSGAFMSVGPMISPQRKWQWAWFVGFGLVYSAFLLAIANWVGGEYVFWLLLGIMLSRMFTLVILEDKKGTMMMLLRSSYGVIVLLLTALMCLIPWPDLGITEDIRRAVFGSSDDFRSNYPERMIAWGVFYFFIMGLIEWYIGWHIVDWKDEDALKAWDQLKK